ncbi:MAG TPA: hypothetical protein PLO51_00625, partial [Candidatus Micrarchaeota archaeon]|nr:hypothetical protein [Candidatus Micrarchaeota archaeon]
MLSALLFGSLLFIAGHYSGTFDFIPKALAGAGAADSAQAAWILVFACFFALALAYVGAKHGVWGLVFAAAVMLTLQFIYANIGVIAGTLAATFIFLCAPFYYYGMKKYGVRRAMREVGLGSAKPGRTVLFGIGAYVFALAISLNELAGACTRSGLTVSRS